MELFHSPYDGGIRVDGDGGEIRPDSFKDSFANCFVPFLAGDYEEIIMIDCRYGNRNVNDILKQHDEIADLLVMYNIRKFIHDNNLHKLDSKAGGMEVNEEDFYEKV